MFCGGGVDHHVELVVELADGLLEPLDETIQHRARQIACHHDETEPLQVPLDVAQAMGTGHRRIVTLEPAAKALASRHVDVDDEHAQAFLERGQRLENNRSLLAPDANRWNDRRALRTQDLGRGKLVGASLERVGRVVVGNRRIVAICSANRLTNPRIPKIVVLRSFCKNFILSYFKLKN